MKKSLLLAIAVCIVMVTMNAQNEFQFRKVKQPLEKKLAKTILDYQVFEFDSKALFQFRQQFNDELSFSLKLGNNAPRLFDMQAKEMRSDDYSLQVEKNGEVKTRKRGLTATFIGELSGEDYGTAHITIDEHFVMGYWQENNADYYLEPLWRLSPDAPRNQYILYQGKSVVYPENFCGVSEATLAESRMQAPPPILEEKLVGECFDVEIALAADFEMFQEFGSVASVENFMLGVLANVQTNYDDEFADELKFVVVTTFIAATNASDPWTNSFNPGTLLDDFLAWGNAGGFGAVDYDVASLWTDRNFQGSTIGVAYVGAVCSNLRYNTMQNFTTNGALLRVVWSHELGHNFDSNHDTSGGLIMSPSVSNTNTWSGQSQNWINNFVSFINCLSECSSGIHPPIADFSFSPEIGCAPLEVDFFDESTGGTPEFWDWSFPGGAPDFSTQQNPTITYFDEGSYDVTLYVENEDGSDSYSIQGAITVLGPPDPDFDVVINGFEVDFFNNSFNAENYEWDFGDGEFSTAASPIYTYNNPGEYEVVLTAYNDCGSTTFSRLIVIESTLVAAFTNSTIEGCAPLEVSFFDNSEGNPTTWDWEFPGGDPDNSSFANPVIDYVTPGNYNVSLTVSNGPEIDMISFTNLVVVAPLPTALFTMDNNTGSGEVIFNNESINADNWLWDFGDEQTSTLENPTHTYTEEGTYTISLIASNECGDDIHTLTVTIVFIPEAGMSVSATSGCAPMTVTYMASPEGDEYSYAWTFPGGDPSTSSMANPSVTYTEAGSYDATLVVTNAAGSTMVTEENIVVVNSAPVAAFTMNNTVGSGLVTFTNQSTNADSWLWDFGDEETATLENPTHTYTEEGTYMVTLTATNECGSDTHTLSVVIVFAPEASMSVSATSGCAPMTVTYMASPEGDEYSYAWTFSGGDPSTSSMANPSVIYTTAGSYDATLIVTNAAGSTTVTEENIVVVNSAPVAAFTINNNVGSGLVTFTNQSTNADSWLWDFGDEEIVTLENPTHTYTEEGTYTVVLTATNECGSDTHTLSVVIVFAPEASMSVSATSGCAPMTVTYMASPEGDEYSYAWTFSGGDPSTSSMVNPSIVYAAAGSYNATLVVTNAAGSTTVMEENIVVVNSAPIADFIINNNTGSGVVNFINQSINADSWSWNFGDEEMATLENPTHTYAEEGTYTATLTATNECGSDAQSIDVVIVFPPNPSIQASFTEGCAPLVVAFQANPIADGNTYVWVFPGGNPGVSTIANPTVTYNEAGSFDASLTVTNAAGVNSATETITIFTVPEAAFTFTVNGLTASFDNNSINADSYSWDIAGAFVVESDPTFTFPGVGEYEVKLIAANECGGDEFIATVVIEGQIPSLNFTATNIEGCSPLMVSFESEMENADDFVWTFDGGTPSSSMEVNPTISYSEPGIYTVTLTASNVYGSNALSQMDIIVVYDSTTAGYSYTIDGATINVENTSTAANSIEWQFPDGSTSSEDNTSFTFSGNGNYEVSLVATGNCNTHEVSETIIIDGNLPVADFSFSEPSNCLPVTIFFADQSSESPTSWEWTFPGGDPAISNEQNVEVSYSTVGEYDVTLEVSNEFGSNQVEQMGLIIVEDIPITPEFTLSSIDDMSGIASVINPNDEYTYEWDFGNDETATGQSVSYSYTETGTYTITLTAINDCAHTVATMDINIIINNVETPEWTSGLVLFPNPTNGVVKLEAQGWIGSGQIDVKLLNILGQVMEHRQINTQAGQWGYSFDWNHLPAGTYMLQLNFGDERWSKKLIIL